MNRLYDDNLVAGRFLGPKIERFLGGPWSLHLPFAYELIRELRPRAFVELGVWKGESYFTFCQSVAENGLQTRCYGIDTFLGDDHTGVFSSELKANVFSWNQRYAIFSTLKQMTFDEAAADFPDGSIDLLHIDGSHRYEDVHNDFLTWLPKVSEGGVILFHDIYARLADFGVGRLWEEIRSQGESFAFSFGYGLGVWQKGKAPVENAFLRSLWSVRNEVEPEIARRFALQGALLAWREKERQQLGTSQKIDSGQPIFTPLSLQIFGDTGAGFSENLSAGYDLRNGNWQTLILPNGGLPAGRLYRLRIDPMNSPGVVSISRIRILEKRGDSERYRAEKVEDFRRIEFEDVEPFFEPEAPLVLFATDVDPKLILPITDLAADFTLEITLRVELMDAAMVSHIHATRLRNHTLEETSRELQAQVHEMEGRLLSSETELHQLQSSRTALEKQSQKLRTAMKGLRTIIRSAEKWQQRSWLKRAFHKWQTPSLSSPPLNEILRKSEFANPNWAGLHMNLDSPTSSQLTEPILVIFGWIFSEIEPVQAVRLIVGGRIFTGKFPLARDDVAEFYASPGLEMSGFTFPEVFLQEGDMQAQIEAQTTSGDWICVKEWPLHFPLPEPFVDGPRIEVTHGELPEFCVYYSSRGNFFFKEIAAYLQHCFKEIGCFTSLRNEIQGPSPTADQHLVVAPHEFFFLGDGWRHFATTQAENLSLLNCEQQQTQWFQKGASTYFKSAHILDMSIGTQKYTQKMGVDGDHLPLGHMQNWPIYEGMGALPLHPDTSSLSTVVRATVNGPRSWRERPIDFSFVGHATVRRKRFFAHSAKAFSKFNYHLRLVPEGGPPMVSHGNQWLPTQITAGLSRRSRVVLNIHRDEERYFEWHRMILLGVWPQALVITETSTPAWPFVAGVDYVEAPLAEIPAALDYYLLDPQGMVEAEKIRLAAHKKFTTECAMAPILRKLFRLPA